MRRGTGGSGFLEAPSEESHDHAQCPEREARWPAAIAIAVAAAVYVLLPPQLVVGPSWLLPVLEGAILIPLMIARPYREAREHPLVQAAAIVLIALVNLANVASLVRLVQFLIGGGNATGRSLLLSALGLWLTNVIVFALWYWEVDRGGPGSRCHLQQRSPDFLFPQMATPKVAPAGWTPGFVDYLYLAFTNATAFSPTDTMPLSPLSKVLMLLQSLVSLIVVALVAARAVNILT